MPPDVLALIAAYLMCSEAAKQRVLHSSEVELCRSLYMDVKLGFVPEVGPDDYYELSAVQRAEVNLRGYAGYRSWRASSPGLVAAMEAEARHRLSGKDGDPLTSGSTDDIPSGNSITGAPHAFDGIANDGRRAERP